LLALYQLFVLVGGYHVLCFLKKYAKIAKNKLGITFEGNSTFRFQVKRNFRTGLTLINDLNISDVI